MPRITVNNPPPVLVAENVSFSRHGQPVVSDISLTLHCGTITAVTGRTAQVNQLFFVYSAAIIAVTAVRSCCAENQWRPGLPVHWHKSGRS